MLWQKHFSTRKPSSSASTLGSARTPRKPDSTEFKYHWPEAVKRLLTALELSQGSIIALVGLSGVGKSSAQNHIAKKLKEKGLKAVHFKWPGYFEANYHRILEFLKEQGITGSNEELVPEIIERAVTNRYPRALQAELKELLPEKWKDLKNLTQEELILSLKNELKGQDAETLARRLLGPEEFRRWQKGLVIHLLSRCHSILLDLRDFGMKDVRAMNTDLAEIQYIWQRINEHLQHETRAPNFVFVLQKELAFSEQARAANYFLGKARIFEITPFTPDDLVGAYKTEFESSYPFEGAGLRRVAWLSRGVFRRFLKYLQLCLELHIEQAGTLANENTISAETVEKALSEEEMGKDWEIELRQIFPKGEGWKNAAKVLNIVILAQGP
ncbi:MAG: P-loop NTPase family protein, partial [Nitrososphaerales archaeon]